MTYEERKPLFAAIEQLRQDRVLICFFNFDRQVNPPGALSGLTTQFHADVKEALFRVLKESDTSHGVDLCLYTRGGDVNSVWPIVSLVREFDPDFHVLVPFRCHSGGTLVTLGAKRIILAPLAELSPIDPTTGNQFNPVDPAEPKNRLGISVEDVRAYKDFVMDPPGNESGEKKLTGEQQLAREGFRLDRLTAQVHPLALGNVHRVLQQIKQLAVNLLDLHPVKGEDKEKIVTALTQKFYSHLHMINPDEARSILGERVDRASAPLATAMDNLLRAYEDTFKLRQTFFLSSYLEDKQESEVRFIGGVVESRTWSYLFETKATIRQVTRPPQNVQVQIPVGQAMPLIPGLPREIQVELKAQDSVHNTQPRRVTT